MLQKFQIHKFNPRTVLFIMPTKTNFILFLVRAEQLKTVMLCYFMFGIRTMTFAWEQLTLLLYKPLLKCFASRMWLLVEEIEPAVLVPEALRQAGNHCQGLTFNFTLTPSYSQLHTRKTHTDILRTYMKEELLARSKYLTQSCVLKFVGHDWNSTIIILR